MKCSPEPKEKKPLGEQEWVEKQLLGPELLVLDVPGVVMERKAILDLT